MHQGHRERMRERIISSGLQSLQPHEILEFLLYYTIPRKDTNPLGHKLLETFGSLSAVLNADEKELTAVEGMTQSAAVFLTSFPALFKEYNIDLLKLKTSLPNPEATVKYLNTLFGGEKVEKVYLICLDAKSNIINRSLVSTGITDTVNVFVREVSEIALKNKATNVILAHNHPSGNCNPSHNDIEFTKAVALSLNMLQITLFDHYIITVNGYFSFRGEGLLENINTKVTNFVNDKIRY